MRIKGLTRTLVLLAGVAVPVIAAIDGGSLGYARLAADDNARKAGSAATEAIRGRPLTEQTALTAYRAASAAAERSGATVAKRDFAVHGDGSVTLTLARTAPALVLDRLPFLDHPTAVTATVTVEPSVYN